MLVEVVVMLAMAVVLSSYERRSMSLLHNRDAPISYLLSGLGQPIADGGKLVMKGTVDTSSMHTTESVQQPIPVPRKATVLVESTTHTTLYTHTVCSSIILTSCMYGARSNVLRQWSLCVYLVMHYTLHVFTCTHTILMHYTVGLLVNNITTHRTFSL